MTHLAGPRNVEAPITRRMLNTGLAAYYPQSLAITVDGAPVDAGDVVVCNLSDKSATEWAHTAPAGKVAVDPRLGRIAAGADAAPPDEPIGPLLGHVDWRQALVHYPLHGPKGPAVTLYRLEQQGKVSLDRLSTSRLEEIVSAGEGWAQRL